MGCTCTVGPGKFEGEGALTCLAWHALCDGACDEEIGRYAIFKAPFHSLIEYAGQAREYGYCDTCIVNGLLDPCFAIALWESDQGFVNCEHFDNEREFAESLFVRVAEAYEEDQC